MAKKTANELLKKVISLFVEEEDEIVGNGLDDAEASEVYSEKNTDRVVNTEIEVEELEEKEPTKEVVKSEIKEKIKSKNIFSKQKSATLEEDLFKEEEPAIDIMDEMKSTPFNTIEIIEMETPVAKSEGKDSYKKVSSISENVTEELTQEQREKEFFFSRLDRGEEVISELKQLPLFIDIKDEVFGEGFEGIFYSLMEAIEDSQSIEKQEKIDKMNGTLSKLLKINIDEDAEVYDFFMMIRHELHKVKNSLGEYSAKVLGDKDLKVDTVLNYDISDMYQNPKYAEALLESDKDKYVELQNLVRDMYFEVENNKFVAKHKKEQMHLEYRDILLSSNTLCDILKNIEIVKDDLYKMRNEIGRFSRTALVLD